MRSSTFTRALMFLTVATLGVASTPADAALSWDPAGGGASDGGGAWLDAGKWWDGGANVDWVSGSDATIGNGGAGATITLDAVTAGTVALDNFTGTYTLRDGSLDQSGGITVGPNAGNVTFRTAVSGTGGITVNGPARVNLRLGGAKTFSGDLIVNDGEVLEYQGDGGDLGTGNYSLNGGVHVDYWGGNFTRTLGTGPGEVQIPGGESGFCGQGRNGFNVRLNNDANYEVVWGSTYFNPSTLVLQSPWANTNGKMTWQNKLDLNGASRTIVVDKDHQGDINGWAKITGVIRDATGGSAGLTKTGVGQLILDAANEYTGDTVVDAGMLTVTKTSLSDTAALRMNTGATLNLTHGQTDVIGGLYMDGSPLAGGIWGAEGSGAEHEADWIMGTGLLSAATTFDPTDFDEDGNSDLIDINALTAAADLPVGLPVALSDPKFDLTGDDMINSADLDQWLTDAATINGFGSPYLKGDANLDGDCDVFAIDGSGDAQILSSKLGTPSGAVWGDGDFNGDGDVDVFAIDGTGDAQLLSSNLGSSSDATAGTAEAIYNSVTGELTFDVGEGIAVVGVGAEGMDHGAVDGGSGLGAPAQNDSNVLAYFSANGLPVGMFDVGAVLPKDLTADDISFLYTPVGLDTEIGAVRVVPEPSTLAMLLILGVVTLCWRQRRG